MVDTTIQIPGYCVTEPIYRSSRTLVYQAIREENQQPVVIKLMRQKYPRFNELVHFRNQYTIAKDLKLPGITQLYSLENYQNGYALVMEDFGGIALREYMSSLETRGGVSLEQFFYIALQITDTLEKLHLHRIIHRDIKPANILINPQTKQVKLTDFSIASLLPKETQTLTSPNVLGGTLAYLSPEQTGRMNRGIDYRSDFYSLGVTFFELLTGEMPFNASDAMELIYCHIAKLPPLAHSINPKIPPILAGIVNKLMAKMAEDRYQSARGLKHDLQVCLHTLETTGSIASFQLGKRDISDHFIISEKLYGRQTEVETLLAAFNRVSSGATEIMLVAGFSGIGKTVVVNEVHKPIVRQKGYFIQGKFDQFGRSIPFLGLVQAFRDLMGQLLSESTEQIKQWKAKILEAVGEQGRVIIDVIPEVELLIGKQPPISPLEPIAAQNRFNLVFQNFIRVFTNTNHPLVMFLDDLQWTDLASLKLIQLLMSESETANTNYFLSSPTFEERKGGLLLIGSYRNNEISNTHPLMLMLEEIRQNGVTVNTITLAPLNPSDLNLLIADTLSCPAEIASPLTQLVYAKTKGNPFFSHQFLRALYEWGLITFNFDVGYWQCDIAQARTLSITDDVMELVALQLQKLPENTQDVLKLAACIGNQFDLETLAIVYEKSSVETAMDLWKALQEGFIIPKNEIYKFFQNDAISNEQLAISDRQSAHYKFLHDRVQQAAYFLIPENQKQSTHVKIGQLFLSKFSLEEREDKIFDIVNQLNAGIELITERTQRNELAELNLMAGRKAKSSTAYATAIKYLIVGIELLGCDRWETNYVITLALYETLAEAAYLNGDMEQMEESVRVVLAQAKTLLDQMKVYHVKIEAYKAQSQGIEAITTGLEVLKLLRIELPQELSQKDIELELQEIQLALTGKKIQDLIHLPQMTDSAKLAVMNILWRMLPITYAVNPLLFTSVVLKQVNLSLKYGNCVSSTASYATYGITLWSLLGDIDSSYQFGQLALKLLARFNAKETECTTIFVINLCIIAWKNHLKQTLSSFLKAYSIGLETGDLEQASYCIYMHSEHSFWLGKNLIDLEQEMANYYQGISQLKQEIALHLHGINWQTVLNLLGRSENSCCLQGEAYNEQSMLPLHMQIGNRIAIFYAYLQKLFLCYILLDYHQARQNAIFAEKYLDAVPAKFVIAIFHFYSSLAMLAIYDDVNELEKPQILEKVSDYQQKMKTWADSASMNFLHKYYLIEAEQHQVLGNNVQAMEMYDRAIFLAKEHEYTNEEALAYELAAKFYLSWGKELIAQTYMVNAYSAYSRWGAIAKLENLKQRYPQLLLSILQREKNSLNPHDTIVTVTATSITNSRDRTTSLSSNSFSDSLDLATAIKASQLLSGEIDLEKLLSTLMRVLIENAGAETGCLILCCEGDLVIEARAISGNSAEPLQIVCLQSIPVQSNQEIPVSLINYVWRTSETLVFNNVSTETTFVADPYIIKCQPKSVLCLPIHNQGQLIGILYLENNLIPGAFTNERLKVLKVLATQAAISLQNAMLYKNLAMANERLEEYSHTLEEKVVERTQELNEKNQRLQQALQELKRTQAQLIQTEKMSSLGQMVAGVAHEINNPINFIYGNLVHADNYVRDLLDLLVMYQQEYPNPISKIVKKMEEIELNFIIEDLPKLLHSMKVGSDRICNIVLSFRNFSRLDEAEMKPVNIHEGIDSTLMILQHRLKAESADAIAKATNNSQGLVSKHRSDIEIVKEYGQLPKVTCYASQINQVFMNILNNAIDALEESLVANTEKRTKPKILIRTELANPNTVRIRFADNGIGMTEEVQQKIFDPFFTTKSVGSGTGLGLSICYQIVVDKHKGQLICHSSPGQGAEFMIEIPVE